MDKPDAIKQRVVDAVGALRLEMASDLERYHFELFPADIEESYGGWLLPAQCRGYEAFGKSYELHRFVERIENRLHDLSDQTITLDLFANRRANRN